MAKIMLVEDDNNLREIYEARLLAEGYEIVSAKDGEEALAMAVKEKPDLIISDVMMPKISGFDMLDILRSTPETKNTKVIMMTALSQAEDKTRADVLGADRYLVKSQVTLEDVAKVARDVLNNEAAPQVPGTGMAINEQPAAPDPTTAAPAPMPGPAPVSPPAEPTVPVVSTLPQPAAATDNTSPASTPSEPPASTNDEPPTDEGNMPPKSEPQQGTPAAAPTDEIENLSQTTSEEEAAVEEQINSFANAPVEEAAGTTAPAASEEPQPESSTPTATEAPAPKPEANINAAQMAETVSTIINSGNSNPESPSHAKKVIQPVSDPTAGPDLNELLQKEAAAEAANTPGATIPAPAEPVEPVPAPTPPADIQPPAGAEEKPEPPEVVPVVVTPTVAPAAPAPTSPATAEEKPIDPNSIAL